MSADPLNKLCPGRGEEDDGKGVSRCPGAPTTGCPPCVGILIVPHLCQRLFCLPSQLTWQGQGDGERGLPCPFQEECFGVSDPVKRKRAQGTYLTGRGAGDKHMEASGTTKEQAECRGGAGEGRAHLEGGADPVPCTGEA